MECCVPAAASEHAVGLTDRLRSGELRSSGCLMPDGTVQYVLSVPGIHCGQCIPTIEKSLAALPGVAAVRVNLTLRRTSVTLDNAERDPGILVGRLAALGYEATAIEPGDLSDQSRRRESRELLGALAVAGFAAGNVMLLSVSVWSGADGATRDLFHLISALIALPAIAYSGRIFFRSALAALRNGHLNMDVPISVGIILTTALSLYESMTGGAEAYFDAALTLTFFLLTGRYFDQLMRDRARNAVTGISKLAAKGGLAEIDGELRYLPLDEIRPGMILQVAAGERIAVDGRVISGVSDLDCALVSGESAPVPAGLNDEVRAGTLNLTGPLRIEALRPAGESFLAGIVQMIEAAETGRGRYVRIADRMSRIYAPFVHLLAAATLTFWVLASGNWHSAVMAAVAVLIITCPCALGLAVPAVHVTGAGKLFRAGILMKDGSALERLAEATFVVFDKTGTLTTGEPLVTELALTDPLGRQVCHALAAVSLHPASRAVARVLSGEPKAELTGIGEVPGKGIEGRVGDKRARLGKSAWVAEIVATGTGADGLAFALEGQEVTPIRLSESLRPAAVEVADWLRRNRLPFEILSGDAGAPVRAIAGQLGTDAFQARLEPGDKVARIQALQAAGEKVLVISDGLNDAPSMVAGHVSMAPASGSDAGRMSADFVFTRESLDALPLALDTAWRARRLVKQNFALAIGYNLIAVPLAMAGLVTPLIAAIAMSGSSILVVGNALRLNLDRRAAPAVPDRGGRKAAAKPAAGAA